MATDGPEVYTNKIYFLNQESPYVLVLGTCKYGNLVLSLQDMDKPVADATLTYLFGNKNQWEVLPQVELLPTGLWTNKRMVEVDITDPETVESIKMDLSIQQRVYQLLEEAVNTQ